MLFLNVSASALSPQSKTAEASRSLTAAPLNHSSIATSNNKTNLQAGIDNGVFLHQ
jgi:hypothetical protein